MVDSSLPEPTFVPVLGRIAAGESPILAEEAVEDDVSYRALVGEVHCSCCASSVSR